MNPLVALITLLEGLADFLGAKLVDVARWLFSLPSSSQWETPTEYP